jgi:hypothetical protein
MTTKLRDFVPSELVSVACATYKALRCAYCANEDLMLGEIRSNLGTGDYVKCKQCGRWQLVPIAGDSVGRTSQKVQQPGTA